MAVELSFEQSHFFDVDLMELFVTLKMSVIFFLLPLIFWFGFCQERILTHDNTIIENKDKGNTFRRMCTFDIIAVVKLIVTNFIVFASNCRGDDSKADD